MLLLMIDPVLDGAPVTICQLSYLVVAHAQCMKSENGGSLDETELGSLCGLMIEESLERGGINGHCSIRC
jgi:hypothetical protein